MTMAHDEIYVSTDIEADGPIPGPYSMLSLGSVALLPDKTELGSFSANLEQLEGAGQHPDTMAWWETQPEAWAACRIDLEPPAAAMERYATWLEALPGRPVFVAYPVTFDFMYVTWYLQRFAGRNPFSHSGLDLKTLAWAMLDRPFSEVSKRMMPQGWFDPLPHDHVALNDARSQGAMFCNMLAEHRGR